METTYIRTWWCQNYGVYTTVQESRYVCNSVNAAPPELVHYKTCRAFSRNLTFVNVLKYKRYVPHKRYLRNGLLWYKKILKQCKQAFSTKGKFKKVNFGGQKWRRMRLWWLMDHKIDVNPGHEDFKSDCSVLSYSHRIQLHFGVSLPYMEHLIWHITRWHPTTI